MKTAIVYYSRHHGNTKKLLDAIALQNEVTLIDATSTNKVDLSEYDRIVLHRAFIIETLPSRSSVRQETIYLKVKKYFISIHQVLKMETF